MDKKVFDAVCGMELNAPQVNYAADHNGENYYFCSEVCKNRFVADPEKYVKRERKGHCCR